MSHYSKEDFEISEHFIIAKFKYDEKAMSILGVQNDTVNGAVIQENIIMLIKENPRITRKELSNKLNKGTTIIYRILKILQEEIIERVGSDKSMYWIAKNSYLVIVKI